MSQLQQGETHHLLQSHRVTPISPKVLGKNLESIQRRLQHHIGVLSQPTSPKPQKPWRQSREQLILSARERVDPMKKHELYQIRAEKFVESLKVDLRKRAETASR